MADGLPRLDRIDLKILAYLQRNGRATNVDLAEAVGLSASPCLMRVRRLEKAERLGLTYEEYTLEILERGRFLQPEDADRIARIKGARRGKRRA